MEVKPLYIYPNKTRMRLFFFSGFALMALSGLLIYFSIYFWAYLLFFVGLFNLFMNFKKAFLNDPVLIIDKLGITDNMNFPTLGLIEWDLIKEVTLASRKCAQFPPYLARVSRVCAVSASGASHTHHFQRTIQTSTTILIAMSFRYYSRPHWVNMNVINFLLNYKV